MRPHELIQQRITRELETKAQAILEEHPELGMERPSGPLPVWSQDTRVVFASALRSALFSCAARRHRSVYLEPEQVPSMPGCRLEFTGTQLSQFDLTVFAECIHMYRGLDPDRPLGLSLRQFSARLGLGQGGRQGSLVCEALMRLSGCQVDIRWDTGQWYRGALIWEVYGDEHAERLVIRLNSRLLGLLNQVPTSSVDWEMRQSMERDLGKWLCGFLHTYGRGTHRIGLDKLAELSGSTNNRVFKSRIKAAMTELVQRQLLQSWNWTSGGALEFIRKQARRRTP